MTKKQCKHVITTKFKNQFILSPSFLCHSIQSNILILLMKKPVPVFVSNETKGVVLCYMMTIYLYAMRGRIVIQCKQYDKRLIWRAKGIWSDHRPQPHPYAGRITRSN